MLLRLKSEVVSRMAQAVKDAGVNEVGGVLVGEHIRDGEFQVTDVSIQTTNGSPACFVRRPEEHAAFLSAFHAKTKHDYGRFNYIGEWHSHPSFTAFPSLTDQRSMQDIVEDPEAAAQFAVLLVVKSHWWSELEVHASAYTRGREPERVRVVSFSVTDSSASWFERLKNGIWGED